MGGESVVGTWYFNAEPIIATMIGNQYNIDFTSGGYTYSKLSFSRPSQINDWMRYDNSVPYYTSGTSGVWNDQIWRTINITGGADIKNPTLIIWLQANAARVA